MDTGLTPEFSLVVRVCVGGLFTAWGVSKLRNLAAFRAAVRSYHLFPQILADAIAGPIAVAETSVGMALLLGFQVGASGAIAIGLLAAFMVAISVNLLQGRRIPCGCHTGVGEPISVHHVLRNLALAAMVVILYFAPPHPWSIDGASSSAAAGSTVLDGTIAIFLAVAIWLIWTIGIKVRDLAGETRQMFGEGSGNGNLDG